MIEERKKTLEKGEKTAKVVVLLSLFIAIIKVGAGLLSKSNALMAGALDSLVDVVVFTSVFWGLKLAKRPPTFKFPYGYYKIENLAAFMVSVFIVIAAVEIGLEGWKTFNKPQEIEYVSIAIGACLLSIFISYLMYSITTAVGEKIQSQALEAEGIHSLTDVFSTFVILAGISLSSLGVQKAEPVAAMFIAVFVLKLGLKSVKASVEVLIDVSPSQKLVEKIEKSIREERGVLNVHDLKLRRSGPFIFLEAKIDTMPQTTVFKAHEVTEHIEAKLKTNLPEIDTVMIHVEPAKKKGLLIAIPVQEEKDLNSIINGHFGRAPFFALITLEDSEVKELHFIENPYASAEKKRGLRVAHLLIENRVNIVLVGEIGEAPINTLENNFVQVEQIPPEKEKGKLSEIIKMFIAKQKGKA